MFGEFQLLFQITDRRVAGTCIVVTWVGFSTSYFAKLKQTDIYHHIHGATAGLWMATLVAEPLLYQYGYLKLHRKIGYIAVYTLVPLLVLGGLKMMQLMVIGRAEYPPGAIYQLGWIDLTSLILFPVFVVLAIRNGRRLQLHARYMACTVLVLLPPAVTRVLFLIPWFDSFNKTLNGSYIINYIVLLALFGMTSGAVRFAALILLPSSFSGSSN